jgi:hypothetical protein
MAGQISQAGWGQFLQHRIKTVVAWVLGIMILTTGLGEQFYNQPQLKVNSTAPQSIYAPADATVEDPVATEQERQKARQIPPILTLDAQETDQNRQQLKRLLTEGQRFRQMIGSLPFVDPQILPLDLQLTLRQCSDQEWSIIAEPASGSGTAPAKTPLKLNQWQQQTLAALNQYRRFNSPAQHLALVNEIDQARQRYKTTRAAMGDPMIAESGYTYSADLLGLAEPDWQTLKQRLPVLAESILAQGVSTGLPEPARSKAFKLHAELILPRRVQPLATQLLLYALQPNIITDTSQTRLQAEIAARQVAPVLITAQKGDLVLRAGQTITHEQFLLLDYFKLSQRTIDGYKFLIFAGLTAVVVLLFRYITTRRWRVQLRRRDFLLIALLALSVALWVKLRIPGTNLPMVGVLLSQFYGPGVAVLTLLSLASLLPTGLDLGLVSLLPSLVAGLLAGIYSARSRSREELALLGIVIGSVQGLVYSLLGLSSGVGGWTLIGATAINGLLGLSGYIVAIGVSPFLEHVFDVVTTLRLVELANLNRPLLKRLAAETPGTFQHTLAVANLAEAAARELGCNVELVRTGTLYHDIGKMHDPLSFIENQMGGVNKHDQLNDPWVSARIIRKHVTEGLVMARKARLPKAVQAFIPEHQGAMLIAYFYYQAQQRTAADPSIALDEQDFRYDGPNPQSRETGIVMLADGCEAALRSLKNATPDIAANMIQKIFRARWQEGGLAKSGLTREDLDRIAEVFIQVWQQSNHQRIAYPTK